jgi:hypothetical protein
MHRNLNTHRLKGEPVSDPLRQLSDLGITVAWARDMVYGAVFVPHQRIMVLNAQCPRMELAQAVDEALTSPRQTQHPDRV